MKGTIIAVGAFAILLVLVALPFRRQVLQRNPHPAAAASPAILPSAPSPAETDPGFLYGRITTVDGSTYEGRLRAGGDQEAFWGDYFNGYKGRNPWAAYVPRERLPRVRRSIEILGIKIVYREQPIDLGRPFLARFGDIARIEARGRDVRVTLKSGSIFDLEHSGASDFDNGVRVWDGKRGAVDVDRLRTRAIELFAAPSPSAPSDRLHGTVRTRHGDFTGFVQWDRKECVGTDALDGRTAAGRLSLRFDTIRSIARRSGDSSLVTLLDGRQIALSGTSEAGDDNRGTYVDDRRYGRVLVSWDAFERVDFSPGGSSPAYGDYPPGRPLTGSVTTRSGRRLAGRLIFDLDESETTETLEAPSQGVNYSIPFGLIASIVPPGREKHGAQLARVTLQNGEELRLERAGDLADKNGGMLIFVDGRQRPEYVPWADVGQVDLDSRTTGSFTATRPGSTVEP